jgi:hypothetical protein
MKQHVFTQKSVMDKIQGSQILTVIGYEEVCILGYNTM